MTEEERNEQPQIKTIDFEGVKYNTEDLTPRVIEGFNMLIKLQGEVGEQSYQLRKSQAAQQGMSAELGGFITEDKIKPVPEEPEIITEPEESNG